MINTEKQILIKEIEEVAQISAEAIIYYKCKRCVECKKCGKISAKNIYQGKSEIEGQCSDYALKFVLLWNEKHPDKLAEIVAVNQEKTIKSGSYKVVKEIIDFIPSFYRPITSQWIINPPEENGINNTVLYHPEIGFYEVELTECYVVKRHFDIDMVNNYKCPHVWAKVEDIAVDPCWADTDNKPFVGIDIIE